MDRVLLEIIVEKVTRWKRAIESRGGIVTADEVIDRIKYYKPQVDETDISFIFDRIYGGLQ